MAMIIRIPDIICPVPGKAIRKVQISPSAAGPPAKSPCTVLGFAQLVFQILELFDELEVLAVLSRSLSGYGEYAIRQTAGPPLNSGM